VARPPRELRAFARLDLEPGASEVVRFRLRHRAFAYWSTRAAGLGGAVRPVRGRGGVVLAAYPRRYDSGAHRACTGPATARGYAPLKEWLADPHGREVLVRAVGTGTDGRPNGIVGDPGRIRTIGNFRLRTLAAFPTVGLDHAIVASVSAEVASSSAP
jgi:beta-glucosidase